MKSFTDLKQSKKLIKILPIESADIHYHYDNDFDELESIPTITEEDDHFVLFPKDVPCWSLAALLKLLPSEFTIEGEYSTTKYEIDIRKYKLTEDVDLYQIAYGNRSFIDGREHWKDMINTGEKENLIDCAFQMVVWLKESGKI